MKDYHNRMPVILDKDNQLKWLSNNLIADEALKLLRPWQKEIKAEVAEL
jgi:putative SOS response-associated peptidase YedK